MSNNNKDYTLEPFDLERSLAGEIVCDEDGNEVTQIQNFNLSATTYTNIGIIKEGVIQRFDNHGKVFISAKQLYMKVPKPKPREIWVNEYERGNLGDYNYNTISDAKSANPWSVARQIKFIEVLDEE